MPSAMYSYTVCSKAVRNSFRALALLGDESAAMVSFRASGVSAYRPNSCISEVLPDFMPVVDLVTMPAPTGKRSSSKVLRIEGEATPIQRC